MTRAVNAAPKFGAWISTLAALVAFALEISFRSWRDWFQGDVEEWR